MFNKINPIIEFHIIQSFPVSCLNRDDVGSPKVAMIGGVDRARVSSQCWKRAVRLQMRDLGVRLGIRSKRIEEKILSVLGDEVTDAGKVGAKKIAEILSKDSLVFLSDKEYTALADYLRKLGNKEVAEAKVKDILKKAKVDALNGLDIALFGRMVAKAPEINVEGAAAFSHAISTHAVGTELDFFTALDDVKETSDEESGSGHMGTSEFNSATYYRYISLNLGQLADNLGIEFGCEDMKTAVSTFIKALYMAVPAARQATMSAACPWEFARIYVRRGQRMQCAFDTPVKAPRDGGFSRASIKALKEELDRREVQQGSLFGKVACLEFGEDKKSIDTLISEIIAAIQPVGA